MDKNSTKYKVKQEQEAFTTKKSRKERRKTADDISYKLGQWFGPKRVFGGVGETKINCMSNADRRRLGLEEDEELEDYQGKKT